jgi:nucleoside-diphosphate-sugar epimerase
VKRLVVWGCGHLGGPVAQAWVRAGGVAVGHTHSERRHDDLRAAGVEPRLGPPADLRPDDALLLAVPGADRLSMCIASLRDQTPPGRVVVCSSTGYYGKNATGAIDEGTPNGPGERALKVAAMEAMFRVWAKDAGVVLRLGGLYQPGRGPLSALRNRGLAPPGPADKALALIHYADAATAALEALRHPAPQDTYLAVTPPCPTRDEFYSAACVILGLGLPTFTRSLRTQPASYDVGRLREDLLPEPAHPRWQEALLPGGEA